MKCDSINVNADKFVEIWIYQTTRRLKGDIESVFDFIVEMVENAPSIGWRKDKFFIYDWMGDDVGINIHDIRGNDVLEEIVVLATPKLYKTKTLAGDSCVLTECTLNEHIDHDAFCTAAVQYFFTELFKCAQSERDKTYAWNIANKLVAKNVRCKSIFEEMRHI